MAKKKRGRKKATHHKSTTKRRKSASHKTHHAVAHKRVNPHKRRRKVTASHKRRHHTKRRHNPAILGAGVVGQAVNFGLASLTLGVVGPLINPLISPLTRMAGQYKTAADYAVTGVGLGWLAERPFMPNFIRKLGPPLQILGISLAIVEIAKPLLRGVIGGAKAVGPQGRGMRGIGPYGGVPQFVPQQKVVSAGPQGVGPYGGVPQFRTA